MKYIKDKKEFLDFKINENFKTQTIKFNTQGIDKETIDTYMGYFREIKDKKYKQLFDNIDGVNIPNDRRIDVDAYKTFNELKTIVDYVRGQVNIKPKKSEEIEVDGKPLFSNDIVEIYYADSPRTCVKYKGNVPYSWCISRPDSSNMYYKYRLGEDVPTFYFIKIKDRTQKELQNIGDDIYGHFDGHFDNVIKDKYHFFIVQVLQNADINNKTQQQYVVTSAINDGENKMSWDDILIIEPRLNGLQYLFNPVPLKDEEKSEEFKKGISDEEYSKLSYEQKRLYIDIYVRGTKLLTDKQFFDTPQDLKNYYVGFGYGLSNNQLDFVKTDKNLYKRFLQVTKRFIEGCIEYSKKIEGGIHINQLKSIDEELLKRFINSLDEKDIENLLKYSPTKEEIKKLIEKYKTF